MARGNNDLVKVTLNLNRKNYEWLKTIHPESGPAVIIRTLIQAYRSATERKGELLLEDIEQLP